MVLDSGNGGDFSIPEGAVAVNGNGFGRHFECVKLPDFFSARDAAKITFGRAGT